MVDNTEKKQEEKKKKKPRFLERARHVLRDADSIPQEVAEETRRVFEETMRDLLKKGLITKEPE